MIVLDTNVISEIMKANPEPSVVSWIKDLDKDSIVTTAITEAELRFGVQLLPESSRKTLLNSRLQEVVSSNLKGRILPFDSSAAACYAKLSAKRRLAGMPINALDAEIAAICIQHSATLATRNIKDFEDTGVEVVNPWDLDEP